MGDQATLCLVLDLLPRRFGDRRQLSVQVIHHSFPFRLPMVSDPVAASAGPPLALHLRFYLGYRLGREQIGAQVPVEDGIAPA